MEKNIRARETSAPPPPPQKKKKKIAPWRLWALVTILITHEGRVKANII